MTRLAIALLVACGSNASKPADQPPSLGGMTEDQRCAAVAARAVPCIDELYDVELMALAGVDTSDEKTTDPEARERLHQARCAVGTEYADAVVTCWHQRSCLAFASCVERTEKPARQARPKKAPSEPFDLAP